MDRIHRISVSVIATVTHGLNAPSLWAKGSPYIPIDYGIHCRCTLWCDTVIPVCEVMYATVESLSTLSLRWSVHTTTATRKPTNPPTVSKYKQLKGRI